MADAFLILCLYLLSILVYLATVFVFVKPHYRNKILLADTVTINEDRSLSNRDATLLDTFMYKNYYCYGIIYPLFIVIKILRASWVLLVADDVKTKEENTKTDFKLHHW